MERETAIITFKIPKRNFEADLEVPLRITANELVIALNIAYNLNIDVSNRQKTLLPFLEAIRP